MGRLTRSADPAGTAATVAAAEVAAHIAAANPHSVTAAQAGADPTGTAASEVATHAALPAAHESVQTGVSASATQTQAAATALTGTLCLIATCATADDAVKLPAAAAGLRCTVKNNGANRCQVFPASGDDLGNGADASTHLNVGQQATWIAQDATTWVELVGPGGVVQKVVKLGIGGGTETATGAGLIETSLQVAYIPRYNTNRIRVTVSADVRCRSDLVTPSAVRYIGYRLHLDSTAGVGNVANGTSMVGSITNGRALVATSAVHGFTYMMPMFSRKTTASQTRVSHTITFCIDGVADTLWQYIKGTTDFIMIEETAT